MAGEEGALPRPAHQEAAEAEVVVEPQVPTSFCEGCHLEWKQIV